MARGPEHDPLGTSAWKKRGGERRALPPIPSHRSPSMCPMCEMVCPLHLYIMTPQKVSICGSAQCTWLTCVSCGITFDTSADLRIQSVWSAGIEKEVNEAQTNAEPGE